MLCLTFLACVTKLSLLVHAIRMSEFKSWKLDLDGLGASSKTANLDPPGYDAAQAKDPVSNDEDIIFSLFSCVYSPQNSLMLMTEPLGSAPAVE